MRRKAPRRCLGALGRIPRRLSSPTPRNRPPPRSGRRISSLANPARRHPRRPQGLPSVGRNAQLRSLGRVPSDSFDRLGTSAARRILSARSGLSQDGRYGKVGKCFVEQVAFRKARAPMGIRESYITVQEAAEILGVAPNTVRKWGAAGKIPEYRHPANGYRLYKKLDLETFLRQIENTSSKSTRRKA